MSSKPEKKPKEPTEAPTMLPAPYVLKGELGRGGMGVVYRAFDPPRNVDVAVKFLPDAGSDENQTVRRFQREGNELAAMSHPNIVAFYGAGRHEGRDYLIMELVEGGNLHDSLKSRGSKLVPVEAAHLFAQIAEGLAHIHDQGLVHRDFKPENVLLTPEGIPKITDFGLARRMEERSRLTSAGTIIGTYSYLAPEQIISSDVGPAADLYAFGCCLYEVLAGRPIFSAETEFALLNSHLREVPVTLRSIDATMAPELDALVLKLVKKVPEERPASAHEVSKILRAFVAKQVPSAPSGGEWSGTIGRQENKAQLEEICLRIKETDAPGVSCLLTAPNGYGRSVVVRELVAALRSKGLTIFTAVPQYGNHLPLREVYAGLGGDLDVFARTLHYGGPKAAVLALREALTRFPKHAMIVADDVSKMGTTTGQMLQCLAGLQPPDGKGWLISCASARASSLNLWEGAVKIDLPPLAADKIVFLAEKELGAPIEKELQDWLVSRAAGSVRRLRLCLYALRSAPCIVESRGRWGWLEGSPPPANYVEPILHGLTQGADSDLKLLRAACLSDEPFPFEVASLAAGLSEDEADASIERLSRYGLLEEAWGGKGEHYIVASPEIKESVVRGLADRTKKRLHSRIVESMSPARGERVDAGARGRHQFEAQQGPDSLGNLTEGATQLAGWGAFSEAAELWQMAHQVVQSIELPELRWRVEVGTVESLWRGGRIEEALALADSLGEQPAPTLPEALAHYRNLQGMRIRLAWLSGKPAAEVESRCRTSAPSAWQQLTYAEVLDALERRPEALKILDELGKAHDLPPAYYLARGRLLRSLNRFREALAPLELALQKPDYLSVDELFTLRWECAECYMGLKEGAAALGIIDAALRSSVHDQEREWEARFWGQRGRCCELAEDWEEATASFADGVKCSRGNNARLAESLVALGHHQLVRRQLPQAESTLREVLQNTQVERFSVQASLGLGIACLLANRLEEAHEWLNQAIGEGAEAAALLLQAEVARLQSNSAQVMELLERANAHLRPITLELGMAQTLKGLLGHPVDRARVLELLIDGPSLTVGNCLRSIRTDWIERVRTMVPASLEPTRVPRPIDPLPAEEVPLQPVIRETMVMVPDVPLSVEPVVPRTVEKPALAKPVTAAVPAARESVSKGAAVVKPVLPKAVPVAAGKPASPPPEEKRSNLPRILIGAGLVGMLAMGIGLVKNSMDQKVEITPSPTTAVVVPVAESPTPAVASPTPQPATPTPDPTPVTTPTPVPTTPTPAPTPTASGTPASGTPTPPAGTPTPDVGSLGQNGRLRLEFGKLPVNLKLDGTAERVTVSPWEKEVPKGKHTVIVAAEGFDSRTLELEVEAGKTATAPPVTLTAAQASVEVQVHPASAKLLVDGRTPEKPSEKGLYRLSKLDVKPHEFKVILNGYQSRTSKPRLAAGKNPALVVSLERNPEPVHQQPPVRHDYPPDRPIERPRPQPPVHHDPPPPPRPRPRPPIAPPDNI